VRVLVVSHLFPTPTDPTSGIFVLEQMRGLRQRGVEVDVISPRPWAPRILSFWSRVRKHLGTSRHSIVDGFDVEYPRVPELPGARLLAIYGVFYYLQCRRLIRRRLGAKHYDLIHAHMVIPDGFACVLLQKEFGLPVVCTAHGEDINDFPFRDRVLLRLTKWVLRRTDTILAVSEDIRRKVEAFGVSCSAQVVHNGANPSLFEPIPKRAARERLGLSREARIALFVGYLVMEKAVDDLLNAFAYIMDSNAMLCIVGDGHLKQPLMELATQLGLGTKCLFAGYQPHDRIVEWLSASDCLVLSSLTEGLPTIIPEAMMSRLPVIATAVGGIPEVIKDGVTGFLVPPGDRKALAATIAKVLQEGKELDNVVLRAEAYAHSNLTWESNAQQTLTAYQAVLGRSHAVSA